MATWRCLSFSVLILISSSLLTIFHTQLGNAKLINIIPSQTLESCKIDKIYQLGDSISDTGNLIREFPIGVSSVFTRLPYGQDFHNHPTGRCSNGLLIIDYIASAAGLPFLNPYKKVDANFTHGANFAVGGATALPTHILEAKNISSPQTNSSLDVQLHWMSAHFNSISFEHKDCAEKLKNALFFVGEIGGNDYNFAFEHGKSIEEVKEMVPEVVEAIKHAARRVIQYGGVRLVIPGDFPLGCFPFYLAAFETDNALAYDEYHCLKDYNNLSTYHNDVLQRAIIDLKLEFPNVTIVYGDNYNAFQWLLDNSRELGFDEESRLKACCGVGGKYNYDPGKCCGAPEASVCDEPRERISWDGVHLTQSAYMIMANWLLATIIRQLQCSSGYISADLSSS